MLWVRQLQKCCHTTQTFWVKRKRWHNRRDLMPRPFVEAKLLCPSPDMINGWLVFTTKERQVLHAREAILPDPVGDQVHLQLEEAEAGSKPPRRLHGKPAYAWTSTNASASARNATG